ncbi:MAG: hypothetical protein CJBNEKGG_01502 [Prosthecobacter sp.]|nr:hypothetical protein [Prosthecobacter sp.]
MSLPADSAEFARLLDRWMDATLTDEEADLLWRCVREHPECAAEFAAAARFEGLLADTIKARDVEAEARKVLAVSPRQTGPLSAALAPASVKKPGVSMRAFAWAAVLVATGVIVALLWPENLQRGVQVGQQKARKPVAPVAVEPLPPPRASLQLPPIENVTAGLNAPAAVEPTLVERLDLFFIRGVSLDQVPLGQAMAELRQALVEKDSLKTLPVERLRVTVPAGALGRRVTFFSGPISYLKAVRAVAALAGCDVEVDDLTIALILQPGIFPQVVEKRVLTDLLAGRISSGGVPMVEDPDRMVLLWEDAASLGIPMAADGTAQLSRGQWEALRLLTDMRDQVGLMPMPTFAVYAVPQDAAPPDGVITPEQKQDSLNKIQSLGLQPVLTFTPRLAGPNNPDPVMLEPDGDRLKLVAARGPMPDTPQQTGPSTLVLGSVPVPGTFTVNPSVTGSVIDAASVRAASGDALGGLSFSTSAQSGVQFVVVPVTSSVQPPP